MSRGGPDNVGFTDRQLDLMNVLWEQGTATVREAREQLDEDLAYTSVLTVFQTLEERGKVRYEEEGKAYRYEPTVSRGEAGRYALAYVLRRFFEDSPEALLASLSVVTDGPEEDAGVAEDSPSGTDT